MGESQGFEKFDVEGAFQDKDDFFEDRWINFYDIGGFFQISGALIKIEVNF